MTSPTRNVDMRELVRLRIVGDDALDDAIAAFAATHGEDVDQVDRDVEDAATPHIEANAYELHAMLVG